MIVGYTTGVYDLFHIGHLNVLQKAKTKCDFLIVGVTTDELVQTRKNKTPIIPLHERMEIVRALDCVDKVVVQDSMDKLLAWKNQKFHKMFVGDDWKGTDVWKSLEIELAKLEVEIVYFSYTTHTSSTKLKEALEKLQ